MKLNEDKELYKGIFWIVDLEELENNKEYCFKIPSDNDGMPLDFTLDLNAKSGITFNHEKVWNSLPSKLTFNKSYNYFPRGRVEISNGKVRIFVNPLLNNEDIRDFLIKEFNLNEYNGITKVIMKSDGSNHYKCHLEDGWVEL